MSAFSAQLDALIAEIRFREEVVLPEKAVEIVTEAAAHGAAEMARILDDPESFTDTGRERVAQGEGEFAGRHVDGTMIDGVGWSVVDNGDEVVGTFGWANPDDYFLAQDWGTEDGHVPAAHSLQKSFLETSALFASLVESASS